MIIVMAIHETIAIRLAQERIQADLPDFGIESITIK
jgi:hypothetical protein